MSYFNKLQTESFPIAQLGAFGDLQIQQMTPLFQSSFVTGIKNQLWTTSTVSTGSVDTNTSRLRLQTGTNSSGSAAIVSKDTMSYRAGQGITVRCTPMFPSSANNSKQYFGVGNADDGYFWGYNNTTFGIFHRVRGVDTFIAQSTWNGDKCDGSGSSQFNWNTSNGVPTMIKYPYLGYGNVFFYVQNPESSAWILCHVIKYANTSTSTQLSNPFLNIYGQVVNSGNTTNLSMFVGSVGVFLDGPRQFLGPQFGAEAARSSVTNQVLLMSILNCTNVNGITNRGTVRLRQISVASQDGNNGSVTIRIRQGATVNSSSYTPVDGSTSNNGVTLTNAQSTISTNTAGTYSGGSVLWNGTLNTKSNFQIDLSPYDITISPGETFVITAQSTTATIVAVSVNWQEEVQ